MKYFGVNLKIFSSLHLQKDGACDVINRMVEHYLKLYFSYHQDGCDMIMQSAEFPYNSSISKYFGMSPFEVELG